MEAKIIELDKVIEYFGSARVKDIVSIVFTIAFVVYGLSVGSITLPIIGVLFLILNIAELKGADFEAMEESALEKEREKRNYLNSNSKIK